MHEFSGNFSHMPIRRGFSVFFEIQRALKGVEDLRKDSKNSGKESQWGNRLKHPGTLRIVQGSQ